MIKLLKSLAFLALLIFWQLGAAQTYNFLSYSLEEGLPQSQIYAMIEDAEGYLWLGTQGGGLSRFNGQQFTNFTTNDGLPSNYIQALIEDKNGRIWIGHPKAISYFENGKIRTHSEENIKVTNFYETDNQLLAKSKKEIYIVEDSTLKKNSNSLSSWNLGEIRATLDLEDGSKLIGTYGDKLLLSKNDSLIDFGEKIGFKANLISDIQQFSKNEIWIISEDAGAIRWNPETNDFIKINDRNGLPTNNIQKILKDKFGNIWMATSGGGLVKFLGNQFIHYNRENGLKGDLVYSISERKNGEFWLADYNKGIARLDSFSITHYGRDSGFLDVKCKALFEDSKQRLWIGTEGKGLGLMEADTFQVFTNENGLPSNWIRGIIETKDSTIWVATSDGIANLKWDSTFTILPARREDYFKTGNTLSLVLDTLNNQIWYGT